MDERNNGYIRYRIAERIEVPVDQVSVWVDEEGAYHSQRWPEGDSVEVIDGDLVPF